MTSINETGFSKDYELLCKLLNTQGIICVVDDHVTKDRFVTTCYSHGILFKIDAFYCDKFELGFINECKRLNLTFVAPKGE